MTYNDTLIFRNHLSSFIKICEQLPQPSNPEAFRSAVELWRATVPGSPILPILEAEISP